MRMEIKMYYEIGIVLFWLLFAYLFMDKFLFKGGLGEICFGKMRHRMAKGLHGVAGWFDPAKEEKAKKKGKKRKAEKPEVSPIQPEPDTMQKKVGKQPEKQVEKDSLVLTKSYGTRQQPPSTATGSQPIADGEKAHTFTDGNEKRLPRKRRKCRRNASQTCSGTNVLRNGGPLPRMETRMRKQSRKRTRRA